MPSNVPVVHVRPGQIDAFVTMDRKLEREHDLTVLQFGVVIRQARSNRVQHLLPLVSRLLEALHRIKPGKIQRIGD
jgi:hypothetical protein